MTVHYDQFLARFTAWAEGRPDIRLAFVVGSRAREVYSADEWGDLDIVFFTTTLAAYAPDPGWLSVFGTVWAATLGRIGSGEHEWLVVYEGGLDADFAMMPIAGELTPEKARAAFDANLYRRGFMPLVDKDNLLSGMPPLPPASNPLPDAGAFTNMVHHFWRHVERTAKKLRRGELWMAKWLCDDILKRALLAVIEWHTQAAHRPSYIDTWYEGHFLEDWADPRAVEGLREAFAHYDAEDVWRALFATMDLFRWLAQETADRLGHTYPTETDRAITGWTEQLFAERASAADKKTERMS